MNDIECGLRMKSKMHFYNIYFSIILIVLAIIKVNYGIVPGTELDIYFFILGIAYIGELNDWWKIKEINGG